ncbi:carbon-nitrogen hydrolase family protein [soil metagenome]
MTTTRTLGISCLQSQGVPGDIAHNLAEVDRAAAQAKADGADLLITPEMFLTGYDCGPIEAVLSQGHDLQRSAADIAVRHQIALLVGMPLRMPDRSVGISAVFLDDTGQTLGQYTKSHLSGWPVNDNDRFTAGSEPTALVDYRGVKIAILICMDLEFPEPARLAALAGADLIAVLTSNMEPYAGINEHLVWTRAWENQTYVAYVNRCGIEGTTHYVGLSSIYAPSGDLLARADGRPALLRADIDPHEIVSARDSFNYLAQRRPNLYSGLTSPSDTAGSSETTPDANGLRAAP